MAEGVEAQDVAEVVGVEGDGVEAQDVAEVVGVAWWKRRAWPRATAWRWTA